MPRRKSRFIPASACLALGILAGCRTEPAPADNQAAPPAEPVPNAAEPAAVAAPPGPLGREEMLLAAIRARSAAATGADDRAGQQPLDNRRFEFRIRLGCAIAGPEAPGSEASGAVDARYEPDQQRVLLRGTPDIAIDDPLVAGIGGERAEAAEGFWVRQPWLLSVGCVAMAAPPGQELGLVQFFTEQEPRTERRDGRAYEIAAPLSQGEQPVPGAWDLVLRGRLRRWGDDRVILCRPRAPNAVPSCLVSVQFEQVSIESVATGETLATWGRG